jgi:hypothetical protein
MSRRERDAHTRRDGGGIGRCATADERERHTLPADADGRDVVEHGHDRLLVLDDDEPELDVHHGRGQRLGEQHGHQSRSALHGSEHDQRRQWHGDDSAAHERGFGGGSRVGERQHLRVGHVVERHVRIDEWNDFELGDDHGLRAEQRGVAERHGDELLGRRRQSHAAGAEHERRVLHAALEQLGRSDGAARDFLTADPRREGSVGDSDLPASRRAPHGGLRAALGVMQAGRYRLLILRDADPL